MGINVYNNQTSYAYISSPLFIDYARQNMKGERYRELKKDSFERRCPVVRPEIYELERLFPNGEFTKIYDDLSKSYELQYPPKWIVGKFDQNYLGRYDHFFNIMTLDLEMLRKPMYKVMLEYKDSEGKDIKGYMPSRTDGRISIIDPKIIKDKSFADKMNMLNSKNVKTSFAPLTDDDKRKYVISVITHELKHASQIQTINQTEGLEIKQLFWDSNSNRTKNLIDKKLFALGYENIFKNSFWADKPKRIKYEKNSDKATYAKKMYDGFTNYTNAKDNFDKYALNPVELDANTTAKKYLAQHYGDFENILPMDKWFDLQSELNVYIAN